MTNNNNILNYKDITHKLLNNKIKNVNKIIIAKKIQRL